MLAWRALAYAAIGRVRRQIVIRQVVHCQKQIVPFARSGLSKYNVADGLASIGRLSQPAGFSRPVCMQQILSALSLLATFFRVLARFLLSVLHESQIIWQVDKHVISIAAPRQTATLYVALRLANREN